MMCTGEDHGLPFTTNQFLDVFAHYNAAVWPVQLILAVLACATAVIAFSRLQRWPVVALAVLSAFWLWMASAYHIAFFALISRAAWVFAAFFLVEAGLLAWSAVSIRNRRVTPSRSQITVAAVSLAYALIGYPLIGYLAGQHYPATPTFGVPCPTTIFTFAILCLLANSSPPILLGIPILWTIVATFAAVRLGVPQDFGLIVAAVVTVMIFVPARASRHARRHAPFIRERRAA